MEKERNKEKNIRDKNETGTFFTGCHEVSLKERESFETSASMQHGSCVLRTCALENDFVKRRHYLSRLAGSTLRCKARPAYLRQSRVLFVSSSYHVRTMFVSRSVKHLFMLWFALRHGKKETLSHELCNGDGTKETITRHE